MTQIIPKKIIAVETNWQKELRMGFSRLDNLLEYLAIDLPDADAHASAKTLFPMRVPRPFADLMQVGNINDPLLQQVMPHRDEFIEIDGYSKDPLHEQDNATRGILHKYQSRVLLLVRGGCAVNCRYCFRRHFPYADNAMNKHDWLEALAHIRHDTNINEVIFSGGDPLMAKDSHLAWLAQQIADISHVKRLRIHTRLPVVIPARVDSDFLAWISQSRLQTIVVLHVNHANEIGNELASKLNELKGAGVLLFNQSVLLKGVNDKADALVELQEKLFSHGVLPYYLHMLDKVSGASHFDVNEEQARALMRAMIKRLPGFLVPRLVREIGGQPGKTPIDLRLIP